MVLYDPCFRWPNYVENDVGVDVSQTKLPTKAQQHDFPEITRQLLG
jgi:hypothetical protein